jgi:hypothetical protein
MLGDEDYAAGVTTIKEKIEMDFPFYHRMDKLFGERQNIRPTHTSQSSRVQCTNEDIALSDDNPSPDQLSAEEFQSIFSNQSTQSDSVPPIDWLDKNDNLDAGLDEDMNAGKTKPPLAPKVLTTKRQIASIDQKLKTFVSSIDSSDEDCLKSFGSHKKAKSESITSSYYQASQTKAQLELSKFEWEKTQKAIDRQERLESAKQEALEKERSSRAMIVLDAMKQGRSCEEIEALLRLSGFSV